MITLLLLLSGIVMMVFGTWLATKIDKAQTIAQCSFVTVVFLFSLGFGLLLIIAGLL